MLSERHAQGVVVRAPAKVNLFLEVLGKRKDGYHEIATLMVAVNLEDTLVLRENGPETIALDCDQPELTTGAENLVVRAARLLQERTGCRRGAAIQLIKRIPLAAGLAGGSTDAAATLAGLNRLWELGLSAQELTSLGSELGSDIPFFFSSGAAWCTGRGEHVEPLELSSPLYLVLVCPQQGLSTAEVYQRVIIPPEPVSGEIIREAVRRGDVETAGRHLHNRLQPAAVGSYPLIGQLCQELAELGPAGVLMSGSGSSVFALCRDQSEAWRIHRRLRSGPEELSGRRMFMVRTCA
jgi:4-diphosphocytidyl-2-C-methyl-D-erythritol kinase